MHGFSDFFVHLVQHFGFLGLFLAMTLANIGAPIGSELVLPAAGAAAAKGLLSSVWIAIAIAVVAELCGQTIAYAIGRLGGRPFLDKYGPYIRFHHAEMDRVERFFSRYGKFSIFICRFVPVVRGVVGIPAGIARMPLAAFYFWTFCGSLLFCGGLILLGHSLGEHADVVVGTVRRYALVILLLGIAALAVFLFLQSRRTKDEPARGASE